MNNDTLIKALAIHQELDLLEQVRDDIKSEYNPGIDDQDVFRLTYMRSSVRGNSKWHIVDIECMKYIGDILDRHDNMIRHEIDERIKELKKELDEL